MHLALRRRQILMPGEFLNRAGWRSAHREVWTARVAEHVWTVVVQTGRCAARSCGVVLISRSLLQACMAQPGRPVRMREPLKSTGW